MKIAENIKAAFEGECPDWPEHTAELAHAIMERALSLSPAELRAFVAPTSKGATVALATDEALQAMSLMARGALL